MPTTSPASKPGAVQVVGPSRAVGFLTQALQTALALVDVRVLNYVVVSGAARCAFAEKGLL